MLVIALQFLDSFEGMVVQEMDHGEHDSKVDNCDQSVELGV